MSLEIDGKTITDNNELMNCKKEFSLIHNSLKYFGFILRYPPEKEDITQVPYEPWHIRYVGRKLAIKLSENKQVLEEYKNNRN